MQQHLLWLALATLGALLGPPADQAPPAPSDHHSSIDSELIRKVVYTRPSGSSTVGLINNVSDANDFFISQYRSHFNPDATNENANCGPASLAMVLRRFFAE